MKPQTHFEVHLVLGKGLPKDIARLLMLIANGPPAKLEFILTFFQLPAHPFFQVSGWHEIFQHACVNFERTCDGCFKLDAVGRTHLEEQDVGLLIRWLREYITHTGVFVPPKYLGFARSQARPPSRYWIAYSVGEDEKNSPLRITFLIRDYLLG